MSGEKLLITAPEIRRKREAVLRIAARHGARVLRRRDQLDPVWRRRHDRTEARQQLARLAAAHRSAVAMIRSEDARSEPEEGARTFSNFRVENVRAPNAASGTT